MVAALTEWVTWVRDFTFGPTTQGYSELERSFEGEGLFETVDLIAAQVASAMHNIAIATQQANATHSKQSDRQIAFLTVKLGLQTGREAKEAALLALHYFKGAVTSTIDATTLKNITTLSPDIGKSLESIGDEKRQAAYKRLHAEYVKVRDAYDTLKTGPATRFRTTLAAELNCDNNHWHNIPTTGKTHGLLKRGSVGDNAEMVHKYVRGAMYYMLDTVTSEDDKAQDKMHLLDLRKRLVIHLSGEGKAVHYWELVRYAECKDAAARAKAAILEAATQE